MTITPLGEEAVIVYLSDEAMAVRFAEGLRKAHPAWLDDVVPAYASVGVFFDSRQIALVEVITWIRKRSTPAASAKRTPRTHIVPVCYDFPLDLPRIAEFTHQPVDEIIRLHLSVEYIVYAIGFVPGFPYMGYLPEALQGVPRLPTPRQRVEPGSVGLTARQTGVYPLARPGGWNLLGYTPLVLVDVREGYFPLRVGDRVQFQRIDEREYQEMLGERLPTGF